MERNDFLKLLQSVGKNTMKNALPELVGLLPVCGDALKTALKAAIQGVEDYNNQKISDTELQKLQSKVEDAAKEELSQTETPVYMDCAIFRCQVGRILSDEQQELLANVFEHEIADDTGMIDSFFDDYMIDEPNRDDDYYVGEDYVSLNFFSDFQDFPYDKDALCRLQQGLNAFLGVDLFDYFVAFGHDEPNHEE